MEDASLIREPWKGKNLQQLQELVKILSKQNELLGQKNHTLLEQNELLTLRMQSCMCFSQQADEDNNQSLEMESQSAVVVTDSQNSDFEKQDFQEMGDGNDVDLFGNDTTLEGLEREDSEDTVDQLQDQDQIPVSGTLSLGTIQLIQSHTEEGGTAWTAQSLGWPITTDIGNFEIVLVSDSGVVNDSSGTDVPIRMSETILPIMMDETENVEENPEDQGQGQGQEVVLISAEDTTADAVAVEESESEEIEPQVRQPGQRGKLAAKLTCSCPICGKRLSGKRSLRQHLPIHTGQKNHTCPECGMSFITRSNLIRHNRKHTGEKPYECIYCGRLFAHLGDLNMHHRTHTGERPFSCHLCENCFVSSAHLRRHLVSHSKKPEGWQGNDRTKFGEDQIHLCQSCGKVFKKRAALKRHLLSHENSRQSESSGEGNRKRDFKCGTCSKAFFTKALLTRHEGIHATKPPKPPKVRKFKCPKCTRLYFTKLALEKHLIAHAEKKGLKKPVTRKRKRNSKRQEEPKEEPRTFTCGHCFKDFPMRVQLNRHIRKLHAEAEAEAEGRQYTCSICFEKFRSKMSYLTHVASVHKDVEEEEEQQEQEPEPEPVAGPSRLTKISERDLTYEDEDDFESYIQEINSEMENENEDEFRHELAMDNDSTTRGDENDQMLDDLEEILSPERNLTCNSPGPSQTKSFPFLPDAECENAPDSSEQFKDLVTFPLKKCNVVLRRIPAGKAKAKAKKKGRK